MRTLTAQEQSPSSQPLLLAQANTEEQIRTYIDSGRKFYRQRQYQEAIAEWEKALELDPENIKVQKYISRAEAKLGIKTEGPVQLEEEVSVPQEETEAEQVAGLIDEGRNYYREGKYEEALKVWEDAYKIDPENKRLSRYLVKVKEKISKDEVEAPESAEAEKEDVSFDDLVTEGKNYFRNQDYKQAVSAWEKALAIKPDDPVLPRYIQKAQSKLEEVAEEKAVQEAAEETPESAQPSVEKTVQAMPEEMPDIASAVEQIEQEDDVIRRDLPWCVNIAIQNHREAKIAEERIKKAKIDLFIARRNFFPNLTFYYSQAQGGSGTDFNTGLNVNETSSSTRDFVRQRYKFQARHLVYSGGRARSEVEKAHIALDVERKDYQRVISQKALEVAKAYYEVARAEADLKIQYQLLKGAESSLKLVEEQFKSGLVSELELLNLKALINQIHSQVAGAKQELSHAVLELQHVMNIDLTTPIRVYPLEDMEIELDRRYTDVPMIRNVQIFEPTQQGSSGANDQLRQDSYVIYALKNRADFAVEQLKLEKAQKEIDIAQTEFYPHFEVYGELGQGAEDSVQNTSDLDLKTEHIAGFLVSWNVWGNTFEVRREEREQAPSVTSIGTEKVREWEVAVGILDNLEPISEKQELVVRRMEALNDLANQKNTIIEEVRDAYHNFLKAKISKDTAKSKIEFRQKSVDLYKLQRSLGELDTSKLLQSEMDLANEMSDLHKSLADYFVQLASLDAAVGKDLFYRQELDRAQMGAVEPDGEADNDTPAQIVQTEEQTEDVASDEIVSYEGFIFKVDDVVTVGPATHKIVDGYKYRKWIALARSQSINLNEYTGQKVRVSGIKVKTEDWIETVIVDSVEVLKK